MPVPTDNLYNLGKLNRWFALSTLALFASLLWMIWEDYDRPWRGFQNDYMVAQAALAHLDYLNTQTEGYRADVRAAEEGVNAARIAAEARADERAGVVTELAEKTAERDGIKIDHGNADAIVQVTRSEYEVARTAYGPDAPATQAVLDRLDHEEAEVARLKKTKEQNEDAQKALRARLKELDAGVNAATKVLTGLEKVTQDAEKKERQYSDILVKSAINAPLMDFTAPKGTPSRHEVRQIILPEVRQELNYLQTYTTDRCTTCHIAIDDGSFTRQELARRFERALPAVNEANQRLGNPTLPYPPLPQLTGDEAPELVDGHVTQYWNFLDNDQRETYFEELLDRVNVYLDQTGRNQIKLDQPLFAHPNLDLFVDVDSAHPMTRIGCTVCHEGNPQETDFVLAAHTPIDHHQEEEWSHDYYVTAAFVPNITFATVEHYWDLPMLPPRYSEAGCVKCHTKISDIAEYQGESQGKKINLGRDLFVRAGCVNCHSVEELGIQRRVGPDLSRVASKVDRKFAESWIFHPKKFRPSTWMPHLFLQENNGPGSENSQDSDPVLRTESEVTAIAHYLYTLSKPFDAETIPGDLTGDAGRGRKLFNETGCLGCHANVVEYGREMIVDHLVNRENRTEQVADALYDEMTYEDRVYFLMQKVPSDRDTVYAPETIDDRPIFTRFAPELSAIGAKVSREWLFSWLMDPSRYDANTRMPSLRLTDQEALDLTEYLLTLNGDGSFESNRFPADAEHTEMVDELVFQILAGQNSVRRSRSIMNDAGNELTERLVSALRTYWGGDAEARSRLSGMDVASKRMLFLGNKMVAHYGCYACHNIGGFETSPPPGTDLSAWGKKPLSQLDFAFFNTAFDHIREAKPEVFDRVHLPENADLIHWSHGKNPEESITHTHAAFAKHKMLNPRIWDREKIKAPYDKLKMPNFYFTEKQADALVTYLLSRKPPRVDEGLKVSYDTTLVGAIADGRSLTRSLNCIGCHKIEGNVATVHQYYNRVVGGEVEFDEVNAPPWLRGQGAKAQFPWFYGFLSQVDPLRPWLDIRMPSFNLSDEEMTTLVQYFAGIAQRESTTLRRHLAGVDDFVGKARARIAARGPGAAPDPDAWYVSDALRETADYLADYGVANRMVISYDVDRATNSVEDLKYGFDEVLKTTRFTANLYDVRFPFADSPRPLVDDERFKLGEEFFYELKCLACHVLGDPNIEGSNSSPSAPNLALTHKRLRQEWVHQWLQEPAVIQPGTKMPQWFASGNSAFSSYSDEDRAALEGKYGATGEEQMRLLMDFMYNAGVKNFTGLQPGGIADAGGAADGDDDEEEDEEEEEEDEEEE